MSDPANWQANSLAFSEPARYPTDSLSSVLREAAAVTFNGHVPPPLLDSFIGAVQSRYTDEARDDPEKSFSEEVAKVLDIVLRVPRARIGAACLQSLLRQNGRSEQEIADGLGVTKAWVSKHMCIIRDLLEIQPRGGRSDEARNTFARKRIERNFQKPLKRDWPMAAVLFPKRIKRAKHFDASSITV